MEERKSSELRTAISKKLIATGEKDKIAIIKRMTEENLHLFNTGVEDKFREELRKSLQYDDFHTNVKANVEKFISSQADSSTIHVQQIIDFMLTDNNIEVKDADDSETKMKRLALTLSEQIPDAKKRQLFETWTKIREQEEQ